MLKTVLLWRGVAPLQSLVRGAGSCRTVALSANQNTLSRPDPSISPVNAMQSGHCGKTRGPDHAKFGAACSVIRWKCLLANLDSNSLAGAAEGVGSSHHLMAVHSLTIEPHWLSAKPLDTMPQLPLNTTLLSSPILLPGYMYCKSRDVYPTTLVWLATTALDEGEMGCSSVMKKRRKKMNKHKHKKWRKKMRFLRRRLGK